MGRPRQSILSVYYTFLIFISVIFIILFSALFRNQFVSLENIKKTEQYAAISADLFSAVKSFGFERGRMNVVLSYKGSSADKASDIQFLIKQRTIGEEAVERALAAIANLNFNKATQTQVAELQAHRDHIQRQRRRAENELAQSFSMRSIGFNSIWFSDMSEYISMISMLAVRFNGLVSDMGLAGKSYIQVLENATLLRDNAGPVCSYTAAAILSPEKFSEEQEKEILMRYSKAKENMYRLKLAVNNIQDSEVTAAAQLLENRHFPQLQAAIDSTLLSLKNGLEFEYSQPAVTKLAVTALSSIKDIVELSAEKLKEYIKAEKQKRYNIIITYAIMCGMTLLFYLNFVVLLNKKIYIPTKKIIEKLKKLSMGDTDIEVRDPLYNDEVADMMLAVRSFRDALIQISASNQMLEKKVAERTEELENKAKEIEMILDIIPVMIFFKDTKDNVIRVNRSAAESLGMSPSDFGVFPSRELFPKEFRKYAKDDRTVIETGKPVYGLTEKYYTKDGRELDVITDKVPVFNSVGDVEYVLIAVNDVTELTKAQHEKKLSYQLLSQQSKMAEIGSLLGLMSHQLKQPLNIISLLSESLEEDSEDLAYARENIRKTVMFMANTIDEFLEFFKPSKTVETFSLGPIICEVYNLLEKQLEKHSIQFEMKDDIPIVIRGYKNEMKQVLMNIMSNSKDAFESSGVENRKISVGFELAEGAAHITICDNAGGIPEELLPERIFELYVSTKNKGGNGMGLFICKNIMEEHMGGSIQAFNAGSGACFRLSFKNFKLQEKE